MCKGLCSRGKPDSYLLSSIEGKPQLAPCCLAAQSAAGTQPGKQRDLQKPSKYSAPLFDERNPERVRRKLLLT